MAASRAGCAACAACGDVQLPDENDISKSI